MLGDERALGSVRTDRQDAEHGVEHRLPERRRVLARAQLAFAQRQLDEQGDAEHADRREHHIDGRGGIEHAQRDRDEHRLERGGEQLRGE